MKQSKNIFLPVFSLFLTALLFMNNLVVFASEPSSGQSIAPSSNSEAEGTADDNAFNGTGEENIGEGLPESKGDGSAIPDQKPPEQLEDTYIVVFLDRDENLLSLQYIPVGGAAAAPTPPVYEGYIFVEWDTKFDNVQSSLYIKPVYKKLGKHAVVINYIKDDGEIVAQPYEVELSTGESFSQRILSPAVKGYIPDKAYVDINIASAEQDVTYTVNYYPSKLTSYMVVHFLQNLEDPSQYTVADTENLHGVTGSIVTAQARNYPGFTRPKDLPYAAVASDGSTLLYVYYTRNTYTISFDTGDGGSLVSPIERPYESAIDAGAIPEPQRVGYTFAGWNRAVPATMPAENVILTAQWKQKKEARYTLQCYLEDPNDENNYTNYIGGFTLMGEVGVSPVIEVNETTRPEILKLEFPSYRTFNWDSYYSLNSEKTQEANAGVVVKSDGTTTLNVYFKRNLHTFVFILDKGSVAGAAYDSSFRIDHGGKTYASGEYSFQAKFGQNIKSLWPKAPYSIDPNKNNIKLNSYYADCSRIYVGAVLNEVTISMLGNSVPGKPIRLIAYPKDPDENLQRFAGDIYLETLEGDFSSKPSETFTRNVNVKEERDAQGNLIKRTGKAEWSVPPRAGFVTTMKWTTINLSKFTLEETPKFDAIYYYRVRSYVDFANVAEPKRVEEVMFEQPLKGIDYIPSPPAGMEGYRFMGWYKDRNFSESAKVDLQTAKMPAKNLLLYAKWEKGVHTVTFDPDNGQPVFTQKVGSKEFATLPSESFTKEGYVFGGWQNVDTKTDFSFTTPIIQDINLKINWVARQDIKYTIYYKNKETGEDLIDPVVSSNGVMGSTITAESEPIEKFLPDSVSKSCVLTPEGASITFEYTPFVTVDYTVHYLDEQENDLLPAQTRTTQHVQVVEDFIVVPGYTPTQGQQTLRLSANPVQNTLTFTYVKNKDAPYKVEYYQQSLRNPGQYDLCDSESFSAPAGTTVTAKENTYTGFAYNAGASRPKLPVHADGSTVLKMYYDRDTFTIAFSAGENGSLAGKTEYAGVPYESLFSDAVAIPQPQAAAGYEFSGWEPALPESDSFVDKDAEYTARFAKNQSLWRTISYEPNGGTGSMAKEEVVADSSYTIPANEFTREGYEFLGWNTEQDGSGNSYGTGHTITVKTDLTLYAQWKAQPASSVPASSSSPAPASSVPASSAPASSAPASSSSPSPVSSVPASSVSASSSPSSTSPPGSSSAGSSAGSSSAPGESSSPQTQSKESKPVESESASAKTTSESAGGSSQGGTSGGAIASGISSAPASASRPEQGSGNDPEAIRKKALEELKLDQVPILEAGEVEIPLYGFKTKEVWALLNLLFMAGGVLCSAWLAMRWQRFQQDTPPQKPKYFRLAAVAAGAALLLLFLATQNLNHLMVIVDRWTPWMFVLSVLQAVFAVLGRAKTKKPAGPDSLTPKEGDQ